MKSKISFAAVLLLVWILAVPPVNAADVVIENAAFCCAPALPGIEPAPYPSPAQVGSGMPIGVAFTSNNYGKTIEKASLIVKDGDRIIINTVIRLPRGPKPFMEGSSSLFETLGNHELSIEVSYLRGRKTYTVIQKIPIYVYDQKSSNLNLTNCDDYQADNYVGVNCVIKNEGSITVTNIPFLAINQSNSVIGTKIISSMSPGQILPVTIVTNQTFPVKTIAVTANRHLCNEEEATCTDNTRYIMNP